MADNLTLLAQLENLELMDSATGQTVLGEDGEKKGEIEGTEAITFNPPVYLQRYGVVQKVLRDLLAEPQNQDTLNGRTVMEVGCAEFGMHPFLKNILGIGKIIYLDIDENLLVDVNII